MSEITELLAQSHSNPDALSRVFVLLYDELKRVARSSLGGGEKTLSPTVLIHETYLRLLGNEQLLLNDRHHFRDVTSCPWDYVRTLAPEGIKVFPERFNVFRRVFIDR